jgi:hypothetical protein
MKCAAASTKGGSGALPGLHQGVPRAPRRRRCNEQTAVPFPPAERRFGGGLRGAFNRLFLMLLCTIDELSDESLAPPCRGANVFWGLRALAAFRTQFATGVARSLRRSIAHVACNCTKRRVPYVSDDGAHLHLQWRNCNGACQLRRPDPSARCVPARVRACGCLRHLWEFKSATRAFDDSGPRNRIPTKTHYH